MALVLKDRVVESSTSSGTGAFTLNGAETGYQSFSAVGSGSTVYYTIEHPQTGEWEVGVGTYTTGSLSRDTVLSSSNSGSLVYFSSGQKNVFIDLPSEKAVYRDLTNVTNSLAGVQFDTSATPTIIAGLLGWDGNNTLSLGMAGGNVTQHIGEDQFYYVKASSAITKGQVCMFTGAVGASGVLTAAPATGTTLDGLYIMGIAAESIANNGFGLIQSFGTLRGIDTSAYTDGTILWYDPTGTGAYTSTQPAKGYTQVVVAAVASAKNNGTLAIRVTYIPEFGELSGLSISSPTTGQALVYNTGTGLWSNSNAVVVNGGSVDNSPIGDTTASTGSFTTLTGGAGSANYGQLTGGATTKAIEWKSLGSDTNVAFAIRSKGTGAIDLAAGSGGVNISNGGTVTAITRTAQGSNYTSFPTVSITAPTTAGGVQATASAQLVAGNTTVANGGTGYTNGDILTVTTAGGSSAITITVTGVTGGVITSATALSGALTTIPTSPVNVSGGTGTGATFNLLYVIASAFTITNAGSGYIEQPTVSFSGGGGSGASAYATVGSATVFKSIHPQMEIWSPQGRQFIIGSAATGTSYAQLYNDSFNRTIFSGSGNTVISSGGSNNLTFQTNSTAQTQLAVAHTASAVNYVQVTGSATTARPVISAQGSDTNIGMNYQTKGNGQHIFYTSAGTAVCFVAQGTSGGNYITANNAATGNAPSFSATGVDTNIDLALTPKGTGLVRFGTLTANADAPITGYITIKDSAGTTRKLAVIA